VIDVQLERVAVNAIVLHVVEAGAKSANRVSTITTGQEFQCGAEATYASSSSASRSNLP
jgi:hypothetical protein